MYQIGNTDLFVKVDMGYSVYSRTVQKRGEGKGKWIYSFEGHLMTIGGLLSWLEQPLARLASEKTKEGEPIESLIEAVNEARVIIASCKKELKELV